MGNLHDGVRELSGVRATRRLPLVGDQPGYVK
jgi:hypothetical protein